MKTERISMSLLQRKFPFCFIFSDDSLDFSRTCLPPFRSLIGLSKWRIKYNIFCHHTSYCNIINNQDELQKPAKNQNLPSVEEIRVLYSHFQSCVPSACPELHSKRKIIITLHACICTYHTISKLSLFRFLLCYVQVSLTFALFLKSVDNLLWWRHSRSPRGLV